jgi:hypothetical protein
MVARPTNGDIRGNPALLYGYYRKGGHRCHGNSESPNAAARSTTLRGVDPPNKQVSAHDLSTELCTDLMGSNRI